MGLSLVIYERQESQTAIMTDLLPDDCVTIAPPKTRRKGFEHCLRVSVELPEHSGQHVVVSTKPRKHVLAFDSAAQMQEWEDALLCGGRTVSVAAGPSRQSAVERERERRARRRREVTIAIKV